MKAKTKSVRMKSTPMEEKMEKEGKLVKKKTKGKKKK